MADTPLPNVPYRTPVLDALGFLTQPWAAFFRGLYLRVGQANALTNTELEALAGGGTFQEQIDALTIIVNANKALADENFSNLNQGPVL
jgi:hypothetical protein